MKQIEDIIHDLLCNTEARIIIAKLIREIIREYFPEAIAVGVQDEPPMTLLPTTISNII